MNPETVKVVNGAEGDAPQSPPVAPKAAEISEERKKELLGKAREAGRAAGEKAAEKVRAAQAEIRKIIGEGRDYTTATGHKIRIPPIDGLKEKRALQVMLSFIANNEDLFSRLTATKDGQFSGAGLAGALLENVPAVYDDAVKLASILLDLPEEEVTKKLVFNDLLEVCSPFLALQAGTIQSVIQNFLPIAITLGRRPSRGSPGAFGSARRN